LAIAPPKIVQLTLQKEQNVPCQPPYRSANFCRAMRCGYAGIGPPSAMRDNPQCETDQARCRTIHNHGRPRIVCMTAWLDVTPKTTEHNRMVRTDKSEAEGTNNKKLLSRYIVI